MSKRNTTPLPIKLLVVYIDFISFFSQVYYSSATFLECPSTLAFYWNIIYRAIGASIGNPQQQSKNKSKAVVVVLH